MKRTKYTTVYWRHLASRPSWCLLYTLQLCEGLRLILVLHPWAHVYLSCAIGHLCTERFQLLLKAEHFLSQKTASVWFTCQSCGPLLFPFYSFIIFFKYFIQDVSVSRRQIRRLIGRQPLRSTNVRQRSGLISANESSHWMTGDDVCRKPFASSSNPSSNGGLIDRSGVFIIKVNI